MSQAETAAGHSGSAVPTKCATCQALRQVPFACEDCHQMLAHVQGADYFELFGLTHSYDLDTEALEEKYLAISRNIHPDKYAMAGDEMQAFALRATAAVNRAYDVLRDPIHRAEYLLESAGGPSASQDKQVPKELLTAVIMLREEIEAATGDEDRAALDRIRRRVLERKVTAESMIAELCRNLIGASDEAKKELRVQLNAMKYLNNLLALL